MLARRAIGIAIPSFHGVYAPAIADGEVADLKWFGQRRILVGGEDLVIQRQFELQLSQAITQSVG